jgi:hypothetical protein
VLRALWALQPQPPITIAAATPSRHTSTMQAGSLKLNKAVVECLRESGGRRLTAREVALWMRERYPEQCRLKLERSKSLQSEADLIQQLVAEIGANRPAIERRHAQVRPTEDRPRLYYCSRSSCQQSLGCTRSAWMGSAVPTRAAGAPPIGTPRPHL